MQSNAKCFLYSRGTCMHNNNIFIFFPPSEQENFFSSFLFFVFIVLSFCFWVGWGRGVREGEGEENSVIQQRCASIYIYFWSFGGHSVNGKISFPHPTYPKFEPGAFHFHNSRSGHWTTPSDLDVPQYLTIGISYTKHISNFAPMLAMAAKFDKIISFYMITSKEFAAIPHHCTGIHTYQITI